MPRLALLLSACLLAACASQPASRSDAPGPDRDTRAPAMPPVTEDAALASRLTLHDRPRVGDYVIHQRLSPQGLTPQQRRTEVVAIGPDSITVRRILGDGAGNPARVHTWRVGRDGSLLSGATTDVASTRVAPAEPLHLVSGRFLIDRIQTGSRPGGGATVAYLDSRVPFQEVVFLTTDERLGRKRLRKLLGQIATLADGAPTRTGNAAAPISDGWLLMHWGRGTR